MSARNDAATQDRSRHAVDGAIHPRGPSTFYATIPSPSRTLSAERRGRQTRFARENMLHASSTRRCRGTTSTGCARSGTVRSCSRGSRPSQTQTGRSNGVEASASRTMAGVNSTTRPHRSRSSNRSDKNFGDTARSSVMVACGGERHRQSDLRWARTRSRSAVPTFMHLAQAANAASPTCFDSCVRASSERWR